MYINLDECLSENITVAHYDTANTQTYT